MKLIFLMLMTVLFAIALEDDEDDELEYQEWNKIMNSICAKNLSDKKLLNSIQCMPEEKQNDQILDKIRESCLRKFKIGNSAKDRFLVSWCNDGYNNCVAKALDNIYNKTVVIKQNKTDDDSYDESDELVDESDKMRICMKMVLEIK